MFGGGHAVDPTEEEERRQARRDRKDRKRLVGKRIQLREDPAVTAYWRQQSPGVWFPHHGMTGTVVKMPDAGALGEGPTVKWDNGRVSMRGSASQFVEI